MQKDFFLSKMRTLWFLVLLTIFISPTAAGWFSSDNKPAPLPYTTWSSTDLANWLHDHNLPVPTSEPRSKLQELVEQNWNSVSSWSYEQYLQAQKSFENLRDSSFDSWDESQLREFLLQHGVVEPKGSKEKLMLLAKQKNAEYRDAARAYSDRASSVVYDEPTRVASRLADILTQATADAARRFQESEEYLYTTWDDNRLRRYLEEKGILRPNEEAQRTDLLRMARNVYSKVTTPLWDAWSTSYMHHWLVNRGLIKPDTYKDRDTLSEKMVIYYYDTNDAVWHTWSDSQLRYWLVDHDIIKSDAEISRDKMIRLVSDNYYRALDTFWDAWADNQVRNWLVANGYLSSSAQLKRDDMIRLANQKFSDVGARVAGYLTWPDARLRAFLRESGIPEHELPTARPGLLRETRIRYIQATEPPRTAFGRVANLLTRTWNTLWQPFGLIGHRASESAHQVNYQARKGAEYMSDRVGEGRDYVCDSAGAGRQYVYDQAEAASQSMKAAGDYVTGRGESAKEYGRDRTGVGAEYVREAGQARMNEARDSAEAGKEYAHERADEARRAAEAAGRDAKD